MSDLVRYAISMMPGQFVPNGGPMTSTHTVDEEIMDFTIARKAIKFRIDSDVFIAYDGLPALTLMEFSSANTAAAESDDEAARNELIRQFQLILRPDSAKLFIDRMRDRENPIGLKHIEKITPWLMEQYGLRPIATSSNSSPGDSAPDNGTNSTVNAVETVSTSGSFPSIGS